MKLLRRILPLALAAIALTLATHVAAIPPPPEGPPRAYPTEFPLSEPDYNYAAMLMPQLGAGRLNAAQQAYDVCSFWPSEVAFMGS